MSEARIFEEQEAPGFVVTDDQKAEWCIRKIQEAQKDKDFWKRHYAAQYAAIEETADATISYMEGLLKDYFRSVPHKVTKTQENYALPSGKLVCKHQEPEFERQDDKLLDWLKKSGKQEFVKVTESVDWAGLKKTVSVVGTQMATEDGEVIPGITVIPREDVFKVEVKHG